MEKIFFDTVEIMGVEVSRFLVWVVVLGAIALAIAAAFSAAANKRRRRREEQEERSGDLN